VRFASDELEAAFREADWAASRWAVRGALLAAAVLLALSLVLDPAGGPGRTPFAWWSRAGAGAVALGVLGASFHPGFHRVRHGLVGLAVAATVVAALLAIVAADGRARYVHFAGLVLAVLGAHTVFRLSVPAAALVSATALAGFAAVARLLDPTGVALAQGLVALGVAWWVGGFAGIHIEWYARRTFRELRSAEEERSRCDALLLDIFPAPVAEKLKREVGGPIAELYGEASVLFADIVEFTRWSSDLEPEDLLRALNAVFAELDRIASDHGIIRIKTIGDAYMAASGVPDRTEIHLERMADAALAIRDRFGAGIDEVPPLRLRIGVAAGPLVAGVIGEKRSSYDLWGDVVTTASRMAAQGVPGEIQVPGDVVERLRGRFRFRSRGEVEIKGKGPMETWILEGRVEREGTTPVASGARPDQDCDR